MQFDFTTLDTSTYVFAGTLILGLVLAAFIAVAAMAALLERGRQFVGEVGVCVRPVRAILDRVASQHLRVCVHVVRGYAVGTAPEEVRPSVVQVDLPTVLIDVEDLR